jgi:hypothetical protein
MPFGTSFWIKTPALVGYTADITLGQTYISSSNESGATPPSEAFDDTTGAASEWRGTEIGAAANGVAYCGVDFTTAKRIMRITLRQGNDGGGARYCTSVLLQYSDNGSSWTTASTHNGLSVGASGNLNSPDVGAHRYWRYLANSDVQAADTWILNEAEMMEGIFA